MLLEFVISVSGDKIESDILSFPSRWGWTFEIGENKRDLCLIGSIGFSEGNIEFTFLQELFTFGIATRKLCWFIGLQTRLGSGRHGRWGSWDRKRLIWRSGGRWRMSGSDRGCGVII